MNNVIYHIGDSVQVLFNGKWFPGTVIEGPKIVLNMRYYNVQFTYKEEDKAPESLIHTFGTSEIRFQED